ncbi:PAS domain S-box protein [Halarcobacter ebronensis]|uniref:histidine kinase n=1 Tax=Halarcobacter ebronensis TaxID=1462615 RepID=A0A4V1M0D0_9BACT|nr:PAS domain S-box protein [Halarcobacter ebronensis]QKF81271.1 PAS sensor-containing signal transduction histidine kinase [Halarcobacter ebronensis]RXK04837.1 hypothetical protein CRV07_09615 [Halarcobacter ebronensis]
MNSKNKILNDYNYLFEHAKVGIIYLDSNGKFEKVNNKFCEILGYEEEELLKLDFSEITYDDDKDRSLLIYNQSKNKKVKNYNIEKRYLKKDGRIVWVEVFINHIIDDNGEFLYTLGFITDISKRKGIQDTILEQTKRMQLYLDIVDVAIVVLNRQGNITLVNRKTSEILNLEEFLLLGKNWFKNFVSQKDRDEQIEHFLDAMEKETNIFEKIQYDVICSNGSDRTILWRRRYIYDENKRPSGMICSGEDMTDYLKLEEEKRRNEEILFNQSKLASMGEMLKNIAHQWRQPLSTISTAASGMKLQKDMNILTDKDFDMGMTAIVETSQYLSQTINELQNFFKVDNKIVKFTNTNLFSKVENFVLKNFSTYGIDLKIVNSQEFEIKAPFNELIQTIINLLNNSKDAFIEKKLENKVVIIENYLERDNFIFLIKDNAGGIDKKVMDRIFEPYFTTKHQKLGTGIGLFMVRDIIINRLKGRIEVYNETIEYKDTKRDGAVFKIIVPKNYN